MPGQDGLEFLEAVRETHPTFPFILFTGKGSEELASEAISADVTDYQQKGPGTEPYDLLANRITKAVSRRRARTNYRELFEKTDVGLAITDPETGRLLETNQAYADIAGHDREDVIGEPPDNLTPDDSPDTETNADRLITRAIEDGPQSSEWLRETENGDERWMTVTLTPATLDDQQRVLVSVEDITERKERELQLRRQNDRLSEFTSVVSHDLRNPLNIASGRLEFVADECDSPHLQDVADAHGRMEQLIDDLLMFARAGSEALDYRTIDLRRLLEECWETLQSCEASLVVETERTVRADRDRLRQLLENLLANALEHGRAGVSVTIGDLADGFYIEDDGPGIPKPDRDDIFEAGYSTSREGTGFGLGIVEEVAEVHGWDVRVTDGTGSGARFEVTGVEFVA